MEGNMIPTVTPKEINEKVKQFCKEISTETMPVYIDVVPYAKGVAGKCFQNVNSYIEEHGGKRIVGWNICRCKNIFLQAESHAIVETEDKKWIDVSPHDGCTEILFLKDETVQGLEHPVKSKYQVLTDSALAKEFIELRKQIEYMQFSSVEGFYLSQEIVSRYVFFMKKFSETRGKNEFCSCGSNIKYKNCCGKEN